MLISHFSPSFPKHGANLHINYCIIVILIYMFSVLVKLLNTWVYIGVIYMLIFFAHFYINL
jgi:hypothetical protein